MSRLVSTRFICTALALLALAGGLTLPAAARDFPLAGSAAQPPAATTNAPAAPADPLAFLVYRRWPERLPPRAPRSPAERAELIRSLREAYAKPPADWPPPLVDPGIVWQEIGLLPPVEHPTNNPTSPAKIELGKMLFFDPRLSGSGQIACASCHDPDLAWADGRTVSFGTDRKPLARNAPSIMNAAYHPVLFWDGRAKSLEDQAAQVLLNQDEMRSSPRDLAKKISAIPGYREKFAAAFGPDVKINLKSITQALACFERTIVGGYSRFDQFLKGRHALLSDEALVGLDLFRREGRCMNCHHGPNFSDGQIHNVGLSYYGRKYEDLGRYNITRQAADVGGFRTPSLRNFGSTAPYMHNGLFPSPRGVMNLYNAGMPTLRRKPQQYTDPLFPTKSPHLRALGLNGRDLDDLVEFLTALTEPYRRVRQPDLPPDEVPAAVSASAASAGQPTPAATAAAQLQP